jgi:hypothetical protein
MSRTTASGVGGYTPAASVSGVSPLSGAWVSGAASVYTGPHMREEQDLTIDFFRVPTGYLDTMSLTLSSVAATFKVSRTFLVAIITASYSKVFDTNAYSTSAYTENQTFKSITVSGDMHGNEYPIPAGDNILGPAGTIYSDRKYYNRRPWDSSIDSAVHRRVVCSNAVLACSSTEPGSELESFALEHMDHFKHSFIKPGAEGSFLMGPSTWSDPYLAVLEFPCSWSTNYYLNGPYDPSDENKTKLVNWIDSIGNSIMNSDFVSIPATPVLDGSTYKPWFLDQGFEEYDISRHDYS